jgi:hypothetical protein
MIKIRSRLGALNGWQRAWCVVVLIWLLVCVAFTYYNLPTSNKLLILYDSILRDSVLIDGKKQVDHLSTECHKFLAVDDPVKYLACIKLSGETRRIYEKNLQEHFDNVNMMIEKNLLTEQLWAMGTGVVLWIIPSIGLYLFGMSVAWTKKGYKHPS